MSTEPAVWGEEQAQRWLRASADRERQLEPISDALFESVDLRPGEAVLDVGCGTGPTTVRAARLVGTDGDSVRGRVVGVDAAPALIEFAARRPQPAGIEWQVADAQAGDLGTAAFDVVLSRFGVMFFGDPGAAFANLGRAARPGARLACAVWRRRDDCPLFGRPYAFVAETLDRLGASYVEPDPGEAMFSLSDPAAVAALLGAGGWEQVRLVPDDRPIYLGGPGDAEHVATAAVEAGPVRGLLEDQPVAVREEVHRRMVAWAADRHDGAGVPLPGGFAVLQARRGG